MRRPLILAAVLTALAAGGVAAWAQSVDFAASRAEAERDRRELAALRQELARLRNDQEAGLAGVAAKRARLEKLNARETQLAAQMGRNRSQLAHLLSALQMFRRDPPPALLVSPDDARDAVRAVILIRAMTPQLQARADALSAQATAVAALRRQAAAASEDLFTSESAVAERRGQIERRLLQSAAIERDRQRAADLISGRVGGGSLVLTAPLEGEVISRFGQIGPSNAAAKGVRFQAKAGQAVESPASGVVEYVGPLEGWGVVLILGAGQGYHLVLAGMDEVTVAVGQSVAAQTPVGRMGDGGKSGPALYLEVRDGETPIDPLTKISPNPAANR